MRKKPTQRATILYRLYQNKQKKNEFVPVYGFIGETYIKEMGEWGWVSYEVSARLSEMFKNNPGLIEREWMKGQSGAQYYGYRLNPAATRDTVCDEDLLEFYDFIKKI